MGLYPDGIPFYLEAELEGLISAHRVDLVVFPYSGVPHVEVMHKALW
jgi:predicted GTPase